jgi:predicted aspartyl protease
MCLIVLCAIANFGFSLNTDKAAQAPAPRAELTLRPYAGALKSVDVTVGRHMLPFILDTGGGISIITPEVAGEVGCIPFGRLTAFRHNGERIELQRCGKVALGVGSMNVDVETAIFDLMAVLRKAGDLPVVGGLIALDAFEKMPVTFDYANNRLTVESPASLKHRLEGMAPLSIRLSRQAGGASLDLFVEVRAKRGTIWLELDSGNNGPVLLSKHAIEQLGLDAAQTSLPLTLDVIGLGAVKCEAAVGDLIYDGLLNARFLNDAVLTVDLASTRAWAKLRSQ